MKSFDILFNKSIKAGKELRFYIYAIFVLTAIFSFLLFLSSNQTFLELLYRENGMVSIMYVLICTVLMAICIYLKSLHSNYFDQICKDSGILICMGMPRKKLKKRLIVENLGFIIMADAAGVIVGFCVYAIVIWHFILDKDESIFDGTLIRIFWLAVISILFVCLVGIVYNQRILSNQNIYEIINHQDGKIKRNANGAVQAVAGLFFLVGGNCVLLYNKIGTAEHSNLLPIVSVCIVCIGIYFTVLSFGYWFSVVLQRKKGTGWNLILLNEVRSQYRNFAKALSAYAIINWLLVFLMVIIMMLVLENWSLDTSDSPFDYVLEFGEDQYDDMEVFLLQQQNSIRECYVIPSLDGYAIYGETRITMIPEESYNVITGKVLNIESGHTIVLSQLDRSMVSITKETDGREWHYWEIDEEIPIGVEGNQYCFFIDYEIWEYLFNCEDSQKRILILNDEDFTTITQQGPLLYKLCINLTENACLDNNMISEDVRLTGKWDQYLRIQKENRILIFSLAAALIVMYILLLLTQHIRYISEENGRKRDYNLQIILGIEKDCREKVRKTSLWIKNFLPVFIGGLTGCLCTICFIKDMNLYLAVLSFTIFLYECITQICVYSIERRFN